MKLQPCLSLGIHASPSITVADMAPTAEDVSMADATPPVELEPTDSDALDMADPAVLAMAEQRIRLVRTPPIQPDSSNTWCSCPVPVIRRLPLNSRAKIIHSAMLCDTSS